MINELSDTEMQKIHKILLAMLKDFDAICSRNRINYFLGGGTLLGAIRHNGFIPWDDDVDLMMLREDYEKLCALPAEAFPAHLFLQTPHTDLAYHGDMPKIRLRNTAYSTEFSERFPEMQQGFFIDIFVHDKTGRHRWTQRLHIFVTTLTRSLVFHKWDKTPMQYYGKHRIICKIFSCLNRIFPMKFWEWMREQSYQFFSKSNSPYLNDGMGQHLQHGAFPLSWLEKSIAVKFENLTLPAPYKYDEYLRYSYGDYMKIPAPQDRKRHKISAVNYGIYEN